MSFGEKFFGQFLFWDKPFLWTNCIQEQSVNTNYLFKFESRMYGHLFLNLFTVTFFSWSTYFRLNCHVVLISLSKKRSWSNLDIFSCDFACSCVFANKRVIITNLLLIWHRINYIANGHFTQFLNAIRLQNGLKSSLQDMSQVFCWFFSYGHFSTLVKLTILQM